MATTRGPSARALSVDIDEGRSMLERERPHHPRNDATKITARKLRSCAHTSPIQGARLPVLWYSIANLPGCALPP